MKFIILISIFLLGHTSAISQVADKATQIEQVQTAVGSLVSSGAKAEFLLNDFNIIKGSVVALTEDTFSLKIKLQNRRKGIIKIFYKDVLVISGKNIAISFIPNPDLRAFGKWDDILKVDYNHNLEVVLDNGESATGRLNEKSKDKITLIGEPNDKTFSLPRDKIVSVYRIWQEYDEVREGTSSGARKGKNVGLAIGITPEGRALSAILGTGIGAVIGSVVGASRKEARLRVLIYSK